MLQSGRVPLNKLNIKPIYDVKDLIEAVNIKEIVRFISIQWNL